MKTPSINQINARLANNPTVQKYHSLDFWSNDYRNRYFNFTLPYSTGDRQTRLTLTGNFIYGAACRELARIRGWKELDYNYHRDSKTDHLTIEGSRIQAAMNVTLRTSISIDGVRITVESDFKPMGNLYNLPVYSNSSWEEFNPVAYFEKKILPAFLYAPGLFRDMQIVWKLTKEEAKEKYSKMFTRNLPTLTTDQDDIFMIDVWRRRFKKKLNIGLYANIAPSRLPAIFAGFTRQKRFMKLFNTPNPFDLHDAYTSNYDTDDYIEEFMGEVFADYPGNSLFI